MGNCNCTLLVVVMFFLFGSCKNYDIIKDGKRDQDNAEVRDQKDPVITGNSTKSGILFFHFNIYKKSSKKETLVLKKVDMVEGGFIKKDYELLENFLPGHLYCSFLNDKEEVIKVAQLENPLIQRVEFSEDGQTIKSKIISKDSAYFFIRTNYWKDIHSVKVELIDSLQKSRKLEQFYLHNFLERN